MPEWSRRCCGLKLLVYAAIRRQSGGVRVLRRQSEGVRVEKSKGTGVYYTGGSEG